MQRSHKHEHVHFVIVYVKTKRGKEGQEAGRDGCKYKLDNCGRSCRAILIVGQFDEAHCGENILCVFAHKFVLYGSCKTNVNHKSSHLVCTPPMCLFEPVHFLFETRAIYGAKVGVCYEKSCDANYIPLTLISRRILDLVDPKSNRFQH